MLLSACSVLPDTEIPPRREFDVIATYRFRGEGEHAVRVPESGPGLTLFELSSVPETTERFDSRGHRFLVLSSGHRLQVTCRGRIDGEPLGDTVRFPPIADLFPGATSVAPRSSR